MLWYEFLCLVTFLIFQLNGEKVIMPDGRTFIIPKAESYKYMLTEDFPLSLQRIYILKENLDFSLLCPKGYSILEITQELVVNLTVREFETPYKHHASLLNPKQADAQTAPCPIIYDCLGYQACLLKFSSKFCKSDLSIPLRVLILFIGCHRDDSAMILYDFPKQKDLVLLIFYESEKGMAKGSISEDNIRHIEWPEEKLFDESCTAFSSQSRWYFQNCSEVSAAADFSLINSLWIILGSARSEGCMQELKEIVCAFLNDKQGLCVPSFYHNKDMKKGRFFSYRSLPEPAPRLNAESYKRFLKERFASLIPVRLAFLIMVYKDASAAVELLRLIYEDTFFYVFHVNNDSLRKELQKKLSHIHLAVQNVFVLPSQKSFKTNWSSYEAVRAKLEGFEELLRFGIWDFVINLSEEDLPLRNMHDLAIALAPYRGLSFLPFLHPVNTGKKFPTESTNKGIFHVCDGQVYKINIDIDGPDKNELQIFESSQWGTFSREFIEYLVDEKLRSSMVNKYQFYLQTHPKPEESYIATILMNSRFRFTVHTTSILISKEEIDCSKRNSYLILNDSFCMQGSQYFSHKEMNQVHSLSHGSFFAQKFHSKSPKNIRDLAVDLASGAYYNIFENILPTPILKLLAEDGLLKLCMKEKLNKKQFAFERVLNLQIVPSLVPHDACCRSNIVTDFKTISDYDYWLEISVLDRINGIYRTARLMLEASTYQRFCYPNGNLRMAFISPWIFNNNTKMHSLEWLNWNQTLPLPYGPAFSNGLSVLLLLSCEYGNLNCSGYYGSNPIVFENGTNFIQLNLKLVSPDQKTRCIKNEHILNDPFEQTQWPTKPLYELYKESPIKSHHLVIRCGEMEPGFWTLLITQEKPRKSQTYKFHFLLVDLQHEDILDLQLSEVRKLWKLNYFAFITKEDIFDFDEDETLQRKHFYSKMPLKKMHDFSATTMLASHTVNRHLQENRIGNFIWFICSGGVTVIVTLSLDIFLMFYNWKYHFYKKFILLMVLSLIFASSLQIAIFVLFCNH